jgi:hypothetical protein
VHIILGLRRLFCQAKANLRRLVAYDEQQEHLINVNAQWENEATDSTKDPTSVYNSLVVKHQQDAQEQLINNFATQHQINTTLNVCRKDIEQNCFELEQIYDGRFDCEYEPIRQYYILFDDLRFDSSIINVKHDFVNDLYAFTCLRYRDIE